MASYQFQCRYTLMDGIIHSVVWSIVSVLTVGVGAFLAGYHINKVITNKTVVLNEHGAECGRLSCDIGWLEMACHALLWAVITVCTFGLGAFVYIYSIERLVRNRSRLELYSA